MELKYTFECGHNGDRINIDCRNECTICLRSSEMGEKHYGSAAKSKQTFLRQTDTKFSQNIPSLGKLTNEYEKSLRSLCGRFFKKMSGGIPQWVRCLGRQTFISNQFT